MLVYLSAFLQDSGLDWGCAPLQDLFESGFREIATLAESFDLVLFTDSETVVAMGSDLGVERAFLGKKRQDASPWAHLAEFMEKGIESDIPAVVLDLRNPTLSADMVLTALQLFEKTPGIPLVSIVAPEDHPVQLRRRYNVVDAGMLHILASTGEATEMDGQSPCAVSRPFPMKWGTAISADSGEIAFATGDDGLLVPLSARGEGCREVWIREGAASARIVWYGEQFPPSVCGACSGDDPLTPGTWLVRDVSGEYGLHIQTQPQGEILRLIPFTEAGLMPDREQEVALITGTGALGSLAPDTCGFVFTVSGPVEVGEFDNELYFSPENGQWSSETNTTKEGMQLYGRQCFPDMYEVDPSIFIGSVNQMKAIQSLLAEGKVGGIMLDDPTSIIQSQFDILRHLVRLERES